MSDEKSFSLHIVNAMGDIPQADWTRCLEDSLSKRKANPFLSHAFLNALELSGCATEATGWMPHHLVLKDGEGEIHAVQPLYLKSHSQGEYVFDHGWADAFERAGGNYYPKLQSAIPFTPANAPKILARKTLNKDVAIAAMASGMKQLCQRYPISSAHLTFIPETEKESFAKEGFLVRRDQQFHWVNEDYEDYEDFLSQLSSRKRKNIRKERKTAQSHGLTIIQKTGTEIADSDWDAFFGFYMDTGARKWGRPYLNRDFFSLIGDHMAEKILLVMAYDGDNAVAGALNFIGGDTLYGRYWGSVGNYPCLHFELCYHQAIDYAIANGLACVEAGAQGEHKLARGYVPQTTWSVHWIDHPAFRQAIEDYLMRERRAVASDQSFLEALSPFKKNDG